MLHEALRPLTLLVAFLFLVGGKVIADGFLSPALGSIHDGGSTIDFEVRLDPTRPNGDVLQPSSATMQLLDDQLDFVEDVPVDFQWLSPSNQYDFYDDLSNPESYPNDFGGTRDFTLEFAVMYDPGNALWYQRLIGQGIQVNSD